MSVLPPKADMARLGRDVRFVPIAEIGLGLHDGTEEQRRSNKTDLYLVRGDDENSNSSGGFGSVGHAAQAALMESNSATTAYHRVTVDGVSVFYREAVRRTRRRSCCCTDFLPPRASSIRSFLCLLHAII